MFYASTRRGRIILQLAITVLTVPFLYPLYAMIRISLQGAGFDNYTAILKTDQLALFFRNSAIIALITLVLTYGASMLAAFAFAKLRVPFRELYYYVLLAALTLPPAVLLVPLFISVERLDMFNTFWAVAVPQAALGIPFSVLVARAYITGIPDELLDAGRIDGCSTFGLFRGIVLPLSKPISAVVIVWTLIGSWNDYMLPLLFLQDPGKQTITLLPQFFQSQYGTDLPKIIASAAITIIPEILVYLAAQRLVDRGLTAGALK